MQVEQRLTLQQILKINRDLGLPAQPPEETLYNQALSDLPTLEPFDLPPVQNQEDGPIIRPENWPFQEAIIPAYAHLLNTINSHIGKCDIYYTKRRSYFTIVTTEPNKAGNWTKVCRTIFLHRTNPILSLDYISESCPPVRATTQEPPADVIYLRLADTALVPLPGHSV
jgi:hypothetical protein